MIRFRLKEAIAEKEFMTKKKVKLEDIAVATGIHRTTLSKIANKIDYNTTTKNLNALCKYFGCKIDAIVEYVPVDE